MAKVFDLGFSRGSVEKLHRDLDLPTEKGTKAGATKPGSDSNPKDVFSQGKTEAETIQEKYQELSRKAALEAHVSKARSHDERALNLAQGFAELAFEEELEGMDQVADLWRKIDSGKEFLS